ncbi:MAG: hypothetical protein R8G66_08300 [Cytophagales bacterium]|nr:hypothetical protein [Cytophagales bacterium]
MIRKLLIPIYLLLFVGAAVAQEETDTTFNKIASRIFLPSFDIGYQFSGSDLIGNSLVAKTSIEYRFRNNDDFFIRLSLDTYGAEYNLREINNTTNNIEGTVQFNDFLLAPGYRFGDHEFRVLVTAMSGIKTYEFPTADLNGTTITVRQKSRSIFTSTFLIAGELYFDQKSAVTLSLHYNQVWKNIDFWEDGGGAYGISMGFITSLL